MKVVKLTVRRLMATIKQTNEITESLVIIQNY